MNITQLQNLSLARSNTGGTSLVTMLIVPNTAITNVTNQIKSEMSLAQNIKSKHVRNSVYSSLQSCLSMISQYPFVRQHIPSNGLVICAGECNSCF